MAAKIGLSTLLLDAARFNLMPRKPPRIRFRGRWSISPLTAFTTIDAAGEILSSAAARGVRLTPSV